FTQLFEDESQLFQTEYSLTGSLLENSSGYVVGPLGYPMLPSFATFTEGAWESTEGILKAFSRMERDFIVKDTNRWSFGENGDMVTDSRTGILTASLPWLFFKPSTRYWPKR
ncbi:MAG TPA: hypothetical protein VGO47_03315, partial [Chlamydiales bacterium]|nr:hypothetical protein [Chlamydiales bacterium]